MIILGVDPSLTCTGIVALDLDTGDILAWETIRTKPNPHNGLKTLDLAYRCFELGEKFRTFRTRYPGVPVVEGQVGASMGRAGMGSVGKLMAGYGAILGACSTRPIVISPPEVKRRLTGSADAAKSDCWTAAMKKISAKSAGELALIKSKADYEAVHDAVAVAIAGLPEANQIAASQPK